MIPFRDGALLVLASLDWWIRGGCRAKKEGQLRLIWLYDELELYLPEHKRKSSLNSFLVLDNSEFCEFDINVEIGTLQVDAPVL